MRISFLALFSLALLLAAPATANEVWHRFAFEGAKFTVAMPLPPTDGVETRTTVIGDVTSQTLTAKDGNRWYMVTRKELPAFAARWSSRTVLAENERGALLNRSWGKQTAWTEAERYGYKGWRLTYSTPPMGEIPSRSGVAEIYVEDTFIVIFDAIVPEGSTVPERYFDSIKVDKDAQKKK